MYSDLLFMVNRSEPFVYEPRHMRVSASQAADLVSTGANCHEFVVNSIHVSPDVASLRDMITGLGLQTGDGEAFLMQQCLQEALESAVQGRYGVGAILAAKRRGVMKIMKKAQNERKKGQQHEFMGHAETRLVDKSTKFLQNGKDHTGDIAAVNLCPCPGCLGLMVDAHFPTVLVGSIDPEVGAAFLKGKDLQKALGKPRMQIMQDKPLLYRFPEIADLQLREMILTLCWDIFHTTRSKVHKNLHGLQLRE